MSLLRLTTFLSLLLLRPCLSTGYTLSCTAYFIRTLVVSWINFRAITTRVILNMALVMSLSQTSFRCLAGRPARIRSRLNEPSNLQIEPLWYLTSPFELKHIVNRTASHPLCSLIDRRTRKKLYEIRQNPARCRYPVTALELVSVRKRP